jgi:hypothetical protein
MRDTSLHGDDPVILPYNDRADLKVQELTSEIMMAIQGDDLSEAESEAFCSLILKIMAQDRLPMKQCRK